jgi:hypothetical protein
MPVPEIYATSEAQGLWRLVRANDLPTDTLECLRAFWPQHAPHALARRLLSEARHDEMRDKRAPVRHLAKPSPSTMIADG